MQTENKNRMELTFCMPVRIDSDDRLQNLLTVLDFFSRHIVAQYIVLEADDRPKLSFLASHENLMYVFMEDTNPVFHRTKYINQMLDLTETPYAAIWDVDAIVPINQLCEAYALLKKKEGAVMVYPFGGKFIMVNNYFSTLFRKQKDTGLFVSGDMPILFMNGYNSVGGGFLVNVALYKQCGGENEHFTGWGPEDGERYRRLEILGHRPDRVEGVLYHLHHERGLNSRYANLDIARITKKEFCNVCGMTKEELRSYIQTWDWIHKW